MNIIYCESWYQPFQINYNKNGAVTIKHISLGVNAKMRFEIMS